MAQRATVKKLPPPPYQQVGGVKSKPEGLVIKMRFSWPVNRGYRKASIIFIRRGGHTGGALEIFQRYSTDQIDRQLFSQGRQFACDKMNEFGRPPLSIAVVLNFALKKAARNPAPFCETEAERAL